MEWGVREVFQLARTPQLRWRCKLARSHLPGQPACLRLAIRGPAYQAQKTALTARSAAYLGGGLGWLKFFPVAPSAAGKWPAHACRPVQHHKAVGKRRKPPALSITLRMNSPHSLRLLGVHHIAIICTDYAISKAFYTEVL
jgi:hypothetical protein